MLKINFSFDTALYIGPVVLELGFWLRDWRLSFETMADGAIHTLQVGPFCLSVTNLKKLKGYYENGKQED